MIQENQNKDGKIIICTKSNTFIGLKEKIQELKSKVKNYEEEINKIKKEKPNKILLENDSLSDDEDIYNESSSDNESIPDDNDLSKKKNNDEFYLES